MVLRKAPKGIYGKQCYEMWNSVKTFRGLSNAMVFSLKNNCPTPWHVSAVDPETNKIKPILIKITETGKMITIEGQPGLCERYDKLPGHGLKQRAYTMGFIQNKNIPNFLINLPKNVAVFIYHYGNKEIIERNPGYNEEQWFQWDDRRERIDLTSEWIVHSNKNWEWTDYSTGFDPRTIGGPRGLAQDQKSLLPTPEQRENIKDTSSFIMLIEHKKCKKGLNETILTALKKS